MDTISLFKDLAIIIIVAKLLGLGAKKLKAPQVAGQIVAGLLIGPSVLGLVQESAFITGMAEIGVVLLMFSAGLETNLKELIMHKGTQTLGGSAFANCSLTEIRPSQTIRTLNDMVFDDNPVELLVVPRFCVNWKGDAN